MSTLSTRLSEDIKTAMRAKDAAALNVLRSFKSALKNAAIEKGGATVELSDAEEVAVLRKQIKQRQDSLESFESAGRDDLAGKEKAEIAVLDAYLPAAMTAEQITELVNAAIAETGATSRAQMGAVMALLKEKTGGSVDGKTLSGEVARRLG